MDEPLTAITALLSAADTHAGLPDETRRCLRQMAVEVKQLADACQELVRAQAVAPAGQARATPVVGFAKRDKAPGLAGVPESGAGGARWEHRSNRAALDPHLAEQVLERVRPSGAPEHDELAKLTPQEQRILDLIAQGCTNRQIAQHLFLAEKTVKNYVSNMLRKLGMERRTQAAIFATHLDRASWSKATRRSRPA